MATEHQTLEASDSDMDDSPQSAVQRGNHILRRLQHAARAARLESQVIELESALNQAREGDPRALGLWLASYDQQAVDEGLDRQPSLQPSEPIDSRIETARLSSATIAEPTSDESGWTVYSQHARRRLDVIQSQLGEALPWHVATTSTVSPHSTALAVSSPTIIQRSVDDLFTDSDPTTAQSLAIAPLEAADDEVQLAGFDEATEATSLLDDELPDKLSEECLASFAELHASEEARVAPSQPLSKRVFGSYGLSILAHALLMIVLGSMTLRAPTEGNSLGSQVLQSAESSSDAELTSEVEIFEPAELQLSEPMSAAVTPSTAMASELAQLAPSTSATPIDIPAADNVGSTLVGAISEAVGKSSGGGSRGAGAPSMSGNFFGVGTGGNYFCYVVDRSGSMRGGAWESAKAELMRSLKSLKPTQKFYIIFFADEFEALPEPGSDQPAATGLYASPENVEHARKWIQSVELNRGGPPNEALAWAIGREPDAIYLLTDGVTKVDVCGFLRKSNRIEDIVSGPQVRVPIHAIAYFSLEGQQLMRQLAKENQGQFIYVPKPKAKK